jgi:hypothetical protein
LADTRGSLAREHEKGVYDMRKLLRRPSPAMIVACLALLVALGGTSVAAVSQLARNSVGTPQLRNGAVTNPKIANNAINSAKVRPRSLLRSDFAAGQLPAGPVGPQGPAGPAGAAGPAGPAGVIGAITVRTSSVSIVDAAMNGVWTSGRIRRDCEGTERSISAGTSWGDDGANLRLVTQELEPKLNAQNQVIGWEAVGTNDTGESSNFSVHVLCYTP